MKRFKVFIPEPEFSESHKVLEEIAEVRVGQKDRRYTEEELMRELEDADALLVTSRERITKKVIAAAKRLKIIAKYGAKPDLVNVDIEAATKKGVPVTWTPSSNADSVAEHAITLIMALMKKIFLSSSHLKTGGWRIETLCGYELMNKTIGIIGLGAVGYKVAEKIRGFGVKILVYDPYISEELAKIVEAQVVGLGTLLKESDVISVHAALTEKTRGLIGERELKMMKKSALIINTARGAIIDEKALYKALKKGWIAGAGLDVFEEEPARPDNPLFTLDNVVVTPHVAAFTYEALRRETFMAAEEVIRVLQGEKPKFVINPEIYSSP